jgi:hypothetical protein
MKHIGFLAKVVKIYQLPHLRLGIFDQVLGMHLVYSHSYNKIFSQLHWSHMLITYKSVARLLYPCQSVVVDLNLRQVWQFFFTLCGKLVMQPNMPNSIPPHEHFPRCKEAYISSLKIKDNARN